LKARLKAASDSKPTAVCDKQGKVSIRLDATIVTAAKR
jgi:hypothetical protein